MYARARACACVGVGHRNTMPTEAGRDYWITWVWSNSQGCMLPKVDAEIVLIQEEWVILVVLPITPDPIWKLLIELGITWTVAVILTNICHLWGWRTELLPMSTK